MEFLSSWANSVTISAIIATLLEMVLPEGKNKKYIKTIIGVYILFAILAPIVNKFGVGEINFEEMLANVSYSNNATIQAASIDTFSSIESIYQSNLKADLKSKLNERGYELINSFFDIELNSNEEYGKIYSIKLQVKPKEKSTGSIEKVEININNSSEMKKEETLTTKEKNELKEYLSGIYDIKKENIAIK